MLLLSILIAAFIYYSKYGKNQDNLEESSIRRKKMISRIKGEDFDDVKIKKDEIPLKTKIIRFVVIFAIVYLVTSALILIGRAAND